MIQVAPQKPGVPVHQPAHDRDAAAEPPPRSQLHKPPRPARPPRATAARRGQRHLRPHHLGVVSVSEAGIDRLIQGTPGVVEPNSGCCRRLQRVTVGLVVQTPAGSERESNALLRLVRYFATSGKFNELVRESPDGKSIVVPSPSLARNGASALT